MLRVACEQNLMLWMLHAAQSAGPLTLIQPVGLDKCDISALHLKALPSLGLLGV